VVATTAALLSLGLVTVAARPSYSATSPVAVAVTASPRAQATNDAVASTIVVTNNGTAPATGLTLTDSFNGESLNALTQPAVQAATGSCTYTAPTETCTDPTIGPGQVWQVTITMAVSAGAGTTYSDTASVTGTESSAAFSTSGTTTSTVPPVLTPGFTQTKLAGGITKPILIDFAPNGDLYIGNQGGTIYIERAGKLLPTPLGTVPNVCDQGEDGLLGVALDPNYATNGYLYVSYTWSATPCTTNAPQGYARLSRFTVAGGALVPSTEKVFYQGNQIQALHHPGNDVKIGPDGKLWWQVADNDPAITNGETLSNIYGKILRFNLDGSVPSDNPFLHVSGAIPYIYAYGLRNPFRMTWLPNGKLLTTDTGSNYWEDLDTVQPGGNDGWDFKEGNCGSCGYLNPTYEYGHYPADGAVSAVAAYTGSTFPKAYDNVVFFGDYNRTDIEAVTLDPTDQTGINDTVFDNNAGTIADLEEGPDGNLYFVSIFEGTVSEISPTGPFPPTASASATPSSGAGPLTVDFSSAAASDPYGKPLTEAWDFGDGSPVSTAADPVHTYTTPGTYTATLLVSNGTTSSSTTTQVVVGPSPPVVSVTVPSTYDAGQTVPFSATATDPQGGVLPPSAYSWKVDFYSHGVLQPSYFAEVADDFYGPVSGITNGSFTIPSDNSQIPGSYYLLTLTVTDALGLQTTVTRELTPNLTSWTATTDVPGAGYSVDGSWETGTDTVQDVVGTQHILTGMASAQTVNGVRYRFVGWSDGSVLTDSFTAGPTPATYTAEFEPVVNSVPSPWVSADIGSPISAGTADYSAADGTFTLDGGGADIYGANDQFHYVYQTLSGDGTIVARVRYQTNSSPWAKAGVMIKQAAVAGSPFVDALVAPDVSPNTPNVNGVSCDANGCLSPLPPVNPTMGYGARMQYSSTGSRTPATYPAGFTDPDKWLKLTKSGNTFTSWLSSDGVTWTEIGVATVPMTGPVTIGLFDTSHNIGQDSTVAFDHVTVTPVVPPPPPGPLPSPWTDTDVGSPRVAGSGGYTGGVFTVSGSGADIWGSTDQFNYVNQPTTGSGTIVARITSQSNTSSNAKAGIIYKQSTTAGSPYLLLAMSPSGVVKAQYDFNGSVQASGTYTFPNVWMKLSWTAVGKVTASLSPDGVNWTVVLTKTLPFTGSGTTGLYVCSHSATTLGTATFDNVSTTSP
jgi:uncharacterized repeat protein (TIGR01451 family)